MADLILVFPKTGLDVKDASVTLPLSLLSVASVVVPHREVKIIDQRIDDSWDSRLKEELALNPVAVGVTSMTGTQIKHALEVSRLVKEGSDVPVIWGGAHPSISPEQTAENPYIDVVVAGEGEPCINPLLDSLEQGLPLCEVPNIYYSDSGKVVRGKTQRYADVEELPPLPYELVDIEAYVRFNLMITGKAGRVLPFISSRGCPHRCAYCCNSRSTVGKWRAMSAEHTFHLVDDMVKRFAIDTVVFEDECFLANPARAEELARLINGRFSWSIQARMDDLDRTDLKLLHEGGLSLVQPGIESGSSRMNEIIKKDAEIDVFVRVNRKLAKTGIVPDYNFMIGFPAETQEDLLATVDLALQLLDDNPRACIAGFYVYVPYPGTELFGVAVEHGFVSPRLLDGWGQFSRQHLDTPWIGDNLSMITNLVFISKFIDGRRLGHSFSNYPLVKPIVSTIGRYYQKKWRRHDFQRTLAVRLMNFLYRRHFEA